MPRRMPHLDANAADLDNVAVSHEPSPVLRRKSILPILAAFSREDQSSVRLPREIASTGDEIRVDVRLGNVRDRRLVMSRRVDVAVDVTVGVDDNCLF